MNELSLLDRGEGEGVRERAEGGRAGGIEAGADTDAATVAAADEDESAGRYPADDQAA